MAKQFQIPNEHRAILIRLDYDHVFFRRNKVENHEVGLWSWSQYQHLLFILAGKTKPIVRESSVSPRSQSDSLAGRTAVRKWVFEFTASQRLPVP